MPKDDFANPDYLAQFEGQLLIPVETVNEAIEKAVEDALREKNGGFVEDEKYMEGLTKTYGTGAPNKYQYTGKKCVTGCKNFTGYETKHHKDCPYYLNSLSEKYDKIEESIVDAQNKWVSVETDDPAPYQSILVTDGKSVFAGGYYVENNKFVLNDNQHFEITFGATDIENFTHWMPSPQLPAPAPKQIA